ncbi:DUF6297 family protein [Arthrobacter sp. CAN_C5]|uniref:DUF6297 family protein n=1 Tax=Arthrobacter sp. CAN_C5 TaxID=2760706 RepID=UPI001AEA8791|nr:DUF6297 family protein [Arthrobacter sp. CAN_C5]MBP2217692.1 hypothetical protein [Arthrobacter sp. CAN_C5]
MPAPDALRLRPAANEDEDGTLATARAVVAFTRTSSRRYNRARTSVGGLFVDIYSNTLALGCVLAIAGSFVFALRDEIARRDPAQGGLADQQWQILPAEVLWILLTYLALNGLLTLTRRLGPASVSSSEGSWWRPLPVDRRPMVLPGLIRLIGGAGVAGPAAYLPFSLLTALDRTPTGHLLTAGTFGLVAVIVVGGGALLQLRASSGRRDVLWPALALLPLAVLPSLGPAVWPPLVACALAIGMLAYSLPKVGAVAGAELVRGGGVSGHAGASVFLLDINELSRALAASPRHTASMRGAKIYARQGLGPRSAIARADIVAFLRLQPGVAGPLVWLGACLALVLADAALPAVVQLLVIVVAGCVTSAGMGVVARRTALVPELDLLLPVSTSVVMLSRTLMPAVAMSAWMVALTGALTIVGVGGPALILLGAVAGLGMGAGSVRAATRPATDWTAPAAETPFGPVPRTQIAALFRGADVTVLSMLPLLLALYIGNVYPWLVGVQIAISAAAIVIQMAAKSTTQSGA